VTGGGAALHPAVPCTCRQARPRRREIEGSNYSSTGRRTTGTFVYVRPDRDGPCPRGVRHTIGRPPSEDTVAFGGRRSGVLRSGRCHPQRELCADLLGSKMTSETVRAADAATGQFEVVSRAARASRPRRASRMARGPATWSSCSTNRAGRQLRDVPVPGDQSAHLGRAHWKTRDPPTGHEVKLESVDPRRKYGS